MRGNKGIDRQADGDLIAAIPGCWVVNLGVGIPTMCSRTPNPAIRTSVYHSTMP